MLICGYQIEYRRSTLSSSSPNKSMINKLYTKIKQTEMIRYNVINNPRIPELQFALFSNKRKKCL